MDVALNLLPADPGATRVPPSGLRHVSGRGTRRGSAGRGTMATREARGKPYRQRPKGAPEDFENVRYPGCEEWRGLGDPFFWL